MRLDSPTHQSTRGSSASRKLKPLSHPINPARRDFLLKIWSPLTSRRTAASFLLFVQHGILQ
jgi:hypothetical protein